MISVVCVDKPESALSRDNHRSGHIEYLKNNKEFILMAGPIKEEQDGPSRGAIFILDFSDIESARQFIEADPFYTGDVYKSVTLNYFKPTFGVLV